MNPLRIINKRGKDDDAEDEEEHEEEELLGRRLERLQQDLEPGRVPRQFEQPVQDDKRGGGEGQQNTHIQGVPSPQTKVGMS